jgi:hypothetical protein
MLLPLLPLSLGLLAVAADEVEIVSLGFILIDAETLAMQPNIASLAGNRVLAIIDLSI